MKKQQDALDREEFREEMDFKKAEAERDQANEDRDYKLALARASSSKSEEEKDNKKDSSKYTVYPSTYNEFVSWVGHGEIMTENLFNASSEMKKNYGTYKNYLKQMYKKYS
jgi:hypothetical protein